MNKQTLQLDWHGYYEYTENNIQKYAPVKAGVYKISVKQKDDKLKVVYVGQANDLDRRLKEHLNTENEQNELLAENIEKYYTEFSFSEIATQINRDGAELALYNHYEPECNDPDGIPNGPDIDINYKK